ncbi:T9SS type A sorting domain-containing protein, partial [uncultured Planktosalinus sp.]|uniref:T9SS type A sorting domain-containing protein n=1 Tax=uncultured Planktosalinus sp. TaxID=1810935 RepID=UPI0030DBA62A
ELTQLLIKEAGDTPVAQRTVAVYKKLSMGKLQDAIQEILKKWNEDGGQNWEAVNAGLPNFQSLALEWQDNQLDGLYLGMNYGVYYIDNTFEEWQVFSNNLPNVIVNELEINYSENKIYAATYGRGLWVSPVYDGVLNSNEIEIFNSLKAYPVPANDFLKVEWNENYLSEIRIFDSTGKLIFFENEINLTNTLQINVSDFSTGIYFLRVNNEKGIFTKKISIN